MLTKFWESVGEGISARWVELLLSPAFIFWGGGLLILAWRRGFNDSWNWVLSLDTNVQISFLVVGLIILSLSSILMLRLRFSAIRLLEGYWPWPFSHLVLLLSALQLKRINRLRAEWNALKEKEEKNRITLSEHKRISELDVQLHYFPANDKDTLPTVFGNTLRAAETSTYYKYGLDAIVCWPRIWLLLPEQVQRDLIDSRQKLDETAEFWAWGFLFLLWAFYSWWVVVVSLIWMLIGYSFLTKLACSYADLFESTFDLYRWDLYKYVHWTPPETSGEKEVLLGKRITEFLWRGTTGKATNFDYSDQE